MRDDPLPALVQPLRRDAGCRTVIPDADLARFFGAARRG
jgi:hypothetical protein